MKSAVFETVKVPTAIKLGGGGLGLNGPAIKKKRVFFAASLSNFEVFDNNE